MSCCQLKRVYFEVFGKVQGVFFRKYTYEKSVELGLKGWCMNTANNTVQGVVEGEVDKINLMKIWLQEKGSPQSRIDKVVFKEENIEQFSFSSFEIRKA